MESGNKNDLWSIIINSLTVGGFINLITEAEFLPQAIFTVSPSDFGALANLLSRRILRRLRVIDEKADIVMEVSQQCSTEVLFKLKFQKKVIKICFLYEQVLIVTII